MTKKDLLFSFSKDISLNNNSNNKFYEMKWYKLTIQSPELIAFSIPPSYAEGNQKGEAYPKSV